MYLDGPVRAREPVMWGAQVGDECWLVWPDGKRDKVTILKMSERGPIYVKGYKWGFYKRTGRCRKLTEGTKLEPIVVEAIGAFDLSDLAEVPESDVEDEFMRIAQAVLVLRDTELVASFIRAVVPILAERKGYVRE